jgi:arylsulfatase A-like enzyme
MKNLGILTVVFVLIFSGCKQNSQTKQANKRPNIVFILSDDQAWNDYGFMGHEQIETPKIDELAAQSLTYTRGYVTAPLCSPSLASMITGLYPHQHGITGNDPTFNFEGKKYTEEWLKQRKLHFDTLIDNFKQLPLLSNILAREGYLSMQTGKWWIGSYKDGGFDYGMTHGDPAKGGRHGDEGLTIGREEMDTIYSFIDKSQQENKPFFLWYAPFLPHTPHNPPDSLLQKYLDKVDSEPVARYYANCEWFDNTVGQLLDHLQQQGMSENTIIFYVCDNGWLQDRNKANRYQEGSKRAPYDLGIRTPIMVKWPVKIEAQMDTSTLVSSIDMVPTVLDILKISQPESMQGISLLATDSLQIRNKIFSEVFAHDIESVQEPTLSLKYRIVVEGEWKLIVPSNRNLPDQETELYHIIQDPFEKINLADGFPDKVAELKNKISQWWQPSFENKGNFN